MPTPKYMTMSIEQLLKADVPSAKTDQATCIEYVTALDAWDRKTSQQKKQLRFRMGQVLHELRQQLQAAKEEKPSTAPGWEAFVEKQTGLSPRLANYYIHFWHHAKPKDLTDDRTFTDVCIDLGIMAERYPSRQRKEVASHEGNHRDAGSRAQKTPRIVRITGSTLVKELDRMDTVIRSVLRGVKDLEDHAQDIKKAAKVIAGAESKARRIAEHSKKMVAALAKRKAELLKLNKIGRLGVAA